MNHYQHSLTLDPDLSAMSLSDAEIRASNVIALVSEIVLQEAQNINFNVEV